MQEYHSLRVDQVLLSLNTSIKGLSEQEAKKRLERYGLNEIERKKRETIFEIFLNQFKNSLILLLIFAGIIAAIINEKIEAFAIGFIIILNVLLGFIQEYKAEKAIEALEKMSTPFSKVIRNDEIQKIPAAQLVPGDIILLEEGEIVPADSRIIEQHSLKIDEASLTGESVPSEKTINPYSLRTPISDQENMAFRGTIVSYGKGKSVITATGMNTEFGKIASHIQTKEEKTPLQIKFEQLTKQIGVITIVLILIVFTAGLFEKTLTFGKMLLFAVVLTVSTLPNSLPVIVTVGLSLGAKRLAKKNMLIRKLTAAESLGAVTVICVDKTGTITKNQMTVNKIFTNFETIEVTGSGYNPKGNFFINNQKTNPKKFDILLRIGCLCNNSKLILENKEHKIIGDPTDGALKVLAKKGNIDEKYISNFNLIEEFPFDSNRKMMSVIFENKKDKRRQTYVKGAPDLLLEKCNRIFDKGKIRRITKEDKKEILSINNSFAEQSLRVLGLAYKDVSKNEKYSIKSIENDLIFIGLTGMIDPPRECVKNSIKKCEDAKIKVIMITGDHALTAKAIAKQIGLLSSEDLKNEKFILTGEQIEKLNDFELSKAIDNIKIIARALPLQKLRIVEALKTKGHVVAMTGDGVNDSPALKKADIGISMGVIGTDVAKETSKAILIDDNFSTIVNGVEEGRNIYDKMIKSARYLLSCNAGEIFSVFIAIMLNFPLPLLPLQVLLMSLLTDDFPALGLGFESSDKDVMKRAPRDPKEKPITKNIWIAIILFGIIMSAATLFIFMQYKDINLQKAQTIAFTTLVMIQMFAVLSSRSLTPSFEKLNPFSNKWLFGAVTASVIIQLIVIYWQPAQVIFGTVNLNLDDWIKIISISAIGFIAMELSKFSLKFGSENKAKSL